MSTSGRSARRFSNPRNRTSHARANTGARFRSRTLRDGRVDPREPGSRLATGAHAPLDVDASHADKLSLIPDGRSSRCQWFSGQVPVEESDLEIVGRVVARLQRDVPRFIGDFEQDDLLSDGAMALIEATTRWDNASPEIHARIERERFIGKVVRSRVIDGMRTRLGRKGDRRRFERRMVRLDGVLSTGLDRDSIIEHFGSLDGELSGVDMSDALDGLPERDREIVRRTVFGGETLAEVGKDYGITESRASKIRTRALELLRAPAPAAVRQLTVRTAAPPEAMKQLTEREHEVLRRVAEGDTNQTIARAMHLSEETIKTHVKHILWKFGVRNRAAAVTAGFRKGLLR